MSEDITGSQIKKLYVRRRRLISPKYKPAPRWKDCWDKIASKVNGIGCDPDDFIEAQFTYMYPFPHPNTMYSSKAEERYRMYEIGHKSGAFAEDLTKRFEYMVNYLSNRMDLGFTARLLLRDDASPFTPVFRVAMSKHFGVDPEEMQKFWKAGYQEYSSHPVYKKIYGQYWEKPCQNS